MTSSLKAEPTSKYLISTSSCSITIEARKVMKSFRHIFLNKTDNQQEIYTQTVGRIHDIRGHLLITSVYDQYPMIKVAEMDEKE